MAKRPFFMCDIESFYTEKQCEFEFYTGFSISQKRKSIESMHRNIQSIYPNAKILEVSTKSLNPIGYRLSAFNLNFTLSNGTSYPLENVFQSSKVFEGNKRYKDLLYCTPKEAKTDERIRNSGRLIAFNLDGVSWDLEPKTAFYDFIYITALMQDKQLCKDLADYEIFTDIEFNPKRSFNCQARSVAIFVSLKRQGKLTEFTKNKESFLRLYQSTTEQTKLF